MTKECVICKKSRGKRVCRLNNNELICPRCCALIRDQGCEGCSYYKFSEKYQATKHLKSGDKHFIIELNEEVEKSVDDALQLIEKGSFEKGEAMITELMKDHPHNHLVQYAKGVLYAFKEQYDEAIEYFDRAIIIFPYFMEAHFNKAVTYQKKLDVGNMIKAYQKVIEIGDPKDAQVKQAKGFLSDLEKQTLKNEGINLETYLKSIEKFKKAFFYMNKQNLEKAIFYFKECIAINKKHPQSYGNIGICYAKLGQKEQALWAFDKAIEIDPNYELAIVNRAVTESLKDNEKFKVDKIESIEYYKEYPMKKRSYIQSVIEEIKGTDNKKLS